MIIGGLLHFITEISKKYRVSQTHILIGFSILVSIIYCGMYQFNPEFTKKGIEFGLQVLGTAVGIYMLISKYNQKSKKL